MLEWGSFGSVRGAPGNGSPYRDPRSAAVPCDLMAPSAFATDLNLGIDCDDHGY